MAGRLLDTWEKGLPFCCREAAKDESLCRLNDSQRPSLLIATLVEIFCSPPISDRIIDPLEPSFRVFISDEFDDHLTMGRGPKCLGSSKICH